MLLYSLFLFILGIVIGSFLNVISLRYSPEEGLNFKKWLGRSHCMNCGKTLSWYELIPLISFFLQKGKCRNCKRLLSWQYPLVELVGGLIFLFPLYSISNFQFPISNYYFLFSSIIWILAFLSFLLIWIIDYRHYIIPDGLVILLAILGFGNIALKLFYDQFGVISGSFLGSYALLFGLRNSIWLNHFVAAFIAALIFGLIILITKGRGMGAGDFKLIIALGILFGWPDILFVIVFAFFIGSLVSFELLIHKKKTLKSHIPFAPFIILSSLTLIFFGKEILEIYFKSFNLL